MGKIFEGKKNTIYKLKDPAGVLASGRSAKINRSLETVHSAHISQYTSGRFYVCFAS